MKHCLNLSIVPVFLVSEAYYVLHFIGLTSGCTGSVSARFNACHPICGELGGWLFKIEMFLVAPLILLVWFLTLQRRGRLIAAWRFLGMVYLLFARFAIASLIGEIEIKPCRWIA